MIGTLDAVGGKLVYNDWAARPAFNLNLNSVLFTSAAVGGKSATGMDSALTAIPAYAGNEWKLTVSDSGRSGFSAATTAVNGSTLTVAYSGAATGANEYISAIIKDNSGNITHYGRLKNTTEAADASGTVTIDLSGVTMAATDTLHIFSEQYNGDYKTDFASAFDKVSLTVEEDTPAPTPGTDKTIMAGTDHISGGQADNIYFGTYQQSSNGSGGYNTDPIKWRVLSNADGELFLLSDQNLDVFQYHVVDYEGVTWEKSTMRSWLNGYDASQNTGGDSGIDYTNTNDNFIGTAFSAKEKVAIADTTVVNAGNGNVDGGNDTTDKIFLLSIAEARNSNYFADDNSRRGTNTAYVADGGKIDSSRMLGVGEADFWWLRSPGDNAGRAAYVHDDGRVHTSGADVFDDDTAVRPAFKLDLTSVLFTSAAVGGKIPADESGGDAIFEIGDYDGNEWKLTLLDSTRNFAAATTAVTGDTLTLSYSGAATGANEYISAIIKDKSGNITHYGRLKNTTEAADASGTVNIDLSGITIPDGGKLYVFNEQDNGGANDDTKLTDYASQLIEISNPSVDTTKPTLSNGSATRDNETNATVKFTSDEAGSYYYAVVDSGEAEPEITTTGTGTSCDTTKQTISLTSLSGAGAKDIYIVVKDAAGNVSDKLKIEIPAYVPSTPPTILPTYCKLTFDVGGGSPVQTQWVTSGSKLSSLPTTTKEGYTFAGWYTDEALTQPFSADTAITKNTVLYAKWTEKADPTDPGEGVTVGRVTGLKAIKKTTTTLKLTFNKVEGASGYEIYDAETNELLTTCTTQKGKAKLVKTITGLNAGEVRKYKVRAYVIVNSEKHYGAFSKVYTKATAERTPVLLATVTKTTNTAIKLEWTPVEGAAQYLVYGGECSKSVARLKRTYDETVTWTNKNLKKATSYKYYVVALDEAGKKIATSPIIHVVTNGSKYGNPEQLTLTSDAVITMTKGGKVANVLTELTASPAEKEPLTHIAALRYRSDDKTVAKVDKDGVITAVNKGTCTVYVIAQNGLYQAVTITVE